MNFMMGSYPGVVVQGDVSEKNVRLDKREVHAVQLLVR